MATGSITLLERELYDETLAADILRVPPSTLHWWLEGGVRRQKKYSPVLRSQPTGSKVVTWGELVEARYLREYRKTHGVQLSALRSFISHLRAELGVPYPLAHARPWVGPGRHLLLNAQKDPDLPAELWACYEPTSGEVLLTHPAESFLERVVFDEPGDNGVVVKLRPAGRESPVVIDPEVRFGSPTVGGIPTETLAELVRAGDSVEIVSMDYELSLNDVVAAIDYENRLAPAA